MSTQRSLRTNQSRVWQFVKFVICGGIVTVFATALYLIFAELIKLDQYLANGISWVLAVSLGFFLHSSWTFSETKVRDKPQALVKFFSASFGTMLINMFWIWLLVDQIHLDTWTPAVPMFAVTPFATFAINKLWVFS